MYTHTRTHTHTYTPSQTCQGKLEKSLENGRMQQEKNHSLWKKMEDMQKHLEQKSFAAQRGQVS